MTKMKDIPNVDRPREKLIKKGASRLKNKELLAILFRSGAKGKSALKIAEEVIGK